MTGFPSPSEDCRKTREDRQTLQGQGTAVNGWEGVTREDLTGDINKKTADVLSQLPGFGEREKGSWGCPVGSHRREC